MRRHLLSPQGQFPAAGLVRRLAAMFYDSLLCIALVMVVTLLYQQVLLRLLYGSEQLQQLADAGARIIAFDGTDRIRPVSALRLLAAIHQHGCIAMADCADVASGVQDQHPIVIGDGLVQRTLALQPQCVGGQREIGCKAMINGDPCVR